MRPDRRDDLCDRFRFHQAGRAAAKENGIQHPTPGFGGRALQFDKIGIAPSGMVNPAADVTVEVTIGAFRLAKGPMDIKAEAPVLPVVSQSSP